VQSSSANALVPLWQLPQSWPWRMRSMVTSPLNALPRSRMENSLRWHAAQTAPSPSIRGTCVSWVNVTSPGLSPPRGATRAAAMTGGTEGDLARPRLGETVPRGRNGLSSAQITRSNPPYRAFQACLQVWPRGEEGGLGQKLPPSIQLGTSSETGASCLICRSRWRR
jgi:hypothetical protein